MSEQPSTPQRAPTRSADLVARTILDETILVPVKGEVAQLQRIFVLNPVAAFIWEQLDGKSSLTDIEERIVDEFEVEAAEARADLHEFVTSLVESGLVVAASDLRVTT